MNNFIKPCGKSGRTKKTAQTGNSDAEHSDGAEGLIFV